MTLYVAHFGAIDLPEGEGLLVGPFGALSTPAAPAAAALDVFDAVHLQVTDEAPLSQVHAVNVEDSPHVHVADLAPLSPEVLPLLDVQDSEHVQASDAVPLSQVHAVNVEDSAHVQASDATSITVVEPEELWHAPSWLLRPELRHKRRKPVGRARINWAHPLTEGLAACYLLNDKQNLVNQEQGSLIDGALLERDGLVVTTDGLKPQNLRVDARTREAITFGTDNFLIVVRAKIDAPVDTSSSLFSTSLNGGSNPGGFEFYYNNNLQSLRFIADGYSDLTVTDASIDDGEYHTLAAFRRGSSLRVSADGGPTTTEETSPGDYDTYFTETGICAEGQLGKRWSGTIESCFIWRGIKDPERVLQAIVEDPYQFLEPVALLDYLAFPKLSEDVPFYYPAHLGRRYGKPFYPVEPNRYSPIRPRCAMLLTERGPYGLTDAITEEEARFYNEGVGSDHWEFDRRKYVDGVKLTSTSSAGTTIYYRAVPGLKSFSAPPYECTLQTSFIVPDTTGTFETIVGLSQPGSDSASMLIMRSGSNVLIYNEDTSLSSVQTTIFSVLLNRVGHTFTAIATKKGDDVALYLRDQDTGEEWSKTDDISSLGTQYARVFNVGGIYASPGTLLGFDDGFVESAFYYDVYVPEPVARALLLDPYLGLKPKADLIPLIPFEVLPPVTLDVKDAAHEQVSDTAPLEVAPALGVRDAVHVQVADEVLLKQDHAFGVADAVHEHLADGVPTSFKYIFRAKDAAHQHRTDHVNFEIVYLLNGLSAVHLQTADLAAIEQRHAFGVLDAVHVQTADEVDLATLHVLGVRSVYHAHASDSAPLAQVHRTGVEGAYHAHAADAVVLYQAGVLVVGDAKHHQFSDYVGFAQVHELGVDSAVHVRASGEVPLAQAHDVAIEDAVHPHAADEVPLAQAHAVGVSGAVHTQAADAAPVDQTHALGARDAVHPHYTDLVALSQVHDVAIEDAVHPTVADEVPTAQAHALAIENAVHPHAADEVPLFELHAFGVVDAVHPQVADEVPLAQVHGLVVEDAVHPHVVDALRFYQAGVLIVGDAEHHTYSDFVGFAQAHVVGVDSAVHVQTADAAPTRQNYAVDVEDAVHVHAARHVDFETVHRLRVVGAAHAQTSDGVELTSFKQLIVGDAEHIHVAGAAALIQRHLLGVADSVHPHYADTVPGTAPPVFTKAPGERTFTIEADPRVLEVVEFIQQCER